MRHEARKKTRRRESLSGCWQLFFWQLFRLPRRSRQGKSPAWASLLIALLPVARSSRRRSGRRYASLAGSGERILPSIIGSQRGKIAVYLSLPRTWFDLIVVTGTIAALAAKRATSTIPSCSQALRTLWVQVWLPVWLGQEAMSRGSR